MEQKSFIYYGYSHATYRECRDMINSTNRAHAIIMNAWFLVMNLLYVLLSAMNLFGVSQELIGYYAIFSFLAVIYGAVLVIFQSFTLKHSIFFVYVNIAMLGTFGVVVSTLQPYMPAIMYFIMFIFVSLLYIGNMIRMLVASILGTFALLACSFCFKTFSIAYHDLYNAMIVLFLSSGLHYMFQRSRIEQFVLYQRDLQIQKELEIKSSFDSLTELLNRGRFFSISEEVLRINESKNEYMVLCLLDLDGFKQINDKMGHQMGDKVIQITGKIIAECIDEGKLFQTERQTSAWDLEKPLNLAGRLGGDEFIVLIRGKNSREEVIPLLQNMLDRLNAVKFDGFSGIQASFGATEIKSSERDMDGAYSRADAALYESKRAGKNQIHFSSDNEENGEVQK